MARKTAVAALALLGVIRISLAAAVLPAPDKDGWIRLFRGNNGGDWYIAYNGPKSPFDSKKPFPDTTFSLIGKDTLRSAGKPGGQVYFNQSFSHYRIRYQMHFPKNEGNCGMLLHVQENDLPMNGYPVSLESQGDPNQGMGQLWPIGDAWVTLHARNKDGRITYDPAARDTTYGGKDWGSRVITGKDGWAKPLYAPLAAQTGWVTQEAEVHGWDSIAHIVSDTVRIQYRHPIISPGGTPNNVKKKLSSGLLAWQSEGTEVWYRNIEIKLFPEDPLYRATYLAGPDRPRGLAATRGFRIVGGMPVFAADGQAARGGSDARGKRVGSGPPR